MAILEVNFAQVAIAALIQFIFGVVWYAPFLFGDTWMEGQGWRKEDARPSYRTFIGAFLVSFVTAWIFAVLLFALQIVDWQVGALFGLLIWLGFGLTFHFSNYLWSKQTFAVFLINAGFLLVSLLFFGVYFTFNQGI